jgi:hypothetical protein
MKRITSCLAIIVVLGITVGCNNQPGNSFTSATTQTKAADIKWVSVNDMAENSFTIDMPEGWKNAAFLHWKWNSPRSLVTAISPDKNTVIYLSDPRLPIYSLPNPQLESQYRQFGMKLPFPSMNYINAETYFSDYMQSRFGKLEGFKILEKFDNKPLLDHQAQEIKKLNFKIDVSNVSYKFEYTSNGKTIHGLLNGATMAMGGIWQPEVSGYCTTGNTEDANDMLMTMAKSRVNNPQWQENQNAKHQQAMAKIKQNEQYNMQQMTRQHEQNMANIQRSGAAHQQRMNDLHQQYDQQNRNWEQSQASQQEQHEKFLNTIKGEHTVRDNEGNTYQVDNSQQRYYVDKNNNTYIGADATTSLDDLRKIKSINIDNFEEVQIIR